MNVFLDIIKNISRAVIVNQWQLACIILYEKLWNFLYDLCNFTDKQHSIIK